MKKITLASILSLVALCAQSQNAVLPETYGAKADFRRDQVSTATGSKQITCLTCNFAATDTGKVVAVKNSRIDAAYRAAAVTMNARIASVQSATMATLDSALSTTNTATEMLWGTNSFNAFQAAADYAFANGITELSCKAGTYYLVPSKANAPTYSGIKGLAIRGNLKISGLGTTMKFGEEDVQRVNAASIYGYAAIHMVGDGNKELSGLTIEAPDRISTETAYQHTDCIYTQQTANIRQNVTIKDCYVKGQWSQGFYSSRGGKWNASTGVVEYFNDYRIERCSIEARRGPIGIFTNDGPTKRLLMTDVDINGGGAINQGFVYCGANISAGSTTLTISGNPSFSWYDFVSQYGNSRKPFVVVGGNFGTFSSTVVSITSPTVAVLASAPASSYTCDTLKWYLNSDFVEGHAVYLHPNISIRLKNVSLKNVNGYGFHIYSSGGQPGKVQFYDIDNVSALGYDGLPCQNAWGGENVNLRPFASGGYATFKNCDRLRLSTGTQFPKSKVYDCNIYDSAISDTSEFYNCTGQLLFLGAGKLYKTFSCNLASFYPFAKAKYYLESTYVSYLKPRGAIDTLQMNGGSLSTLYLMELDSAAIQNTGAYRFSQTSRMPPRPGFENLHMPNVSGTMLTALRNKMTGLFTFRLSKGTWIGFGENKEISVAIDFPATLPGAFSDLSVSFPEAELSSFVEALPPPDLSALKGRFWAWTSAPGVTTVRFFNNDSILIDLAQKPFTLRIQK